VSIVAIIALLVKALQYTPEAYEAVKKIVTVWEEQTGETVTADEWDTIDEMLKAPAEYIKSSDAA
jgi:hypothetical protein